jgi:hypothetical protein
VSRRKIWALRKKNDPTKVECCISWLNKVLGVMWGLDEIRCLWERRMGNVMKGGVCQGSRVVLITHCMWQTTVSPRSSLSCLLIWAWNQQPMSPSITLVKFLLFWEWLRILHLKTGKISREKRLCLFCGVSHGPHGTALLSIPLKPHPGSHCGFRAQSELTPGGSS